MASASADNSEKKSSKPSSAECSPKKGQMTLSTSTSSYSPLEMHDPHLNRLASAMFQKTEEYLQSELTSSKAEYQLLEQMNRTTTAKYRDLQQIAAAAGKGLTELNEKFKNLQGYLDQIDQIEDHITKLEQAAFKLDAYTVRLENKFKTLTAEKR